MNTFPQKILSISRDYQNKDD